MEGLEVLIVYVLNIFTRTYNILDSGVVPLLETAVCEKTNGMRGSLIENTCLGTYSHKSRKLSFNILLAAARPKVAGVCRERVYDLEGETNWMSSLTSSMWCYVESWSIIILLFQIITNWNTFLNTSNIFKNSLQQMHCCYYSTLRDNCVIYTLNYMF